MKNRTEWHSVSRTDRRRAGETAISTVRRIINAYPRDLIAKLAISLLESTVRHIDGGCGGGHRLLRTEQFDRLCRKLTQSKLSIIMP
ncbi:hypothetical protein F5Y07DRAFT_354540 [Xylaria sp. FL0933]|nr:hypothetical protein F5Y07DRAFT_354540 [Xylaria sp. FL0933]